MGIGLTSGAVTIKAIPIYGGTFFSKNLLVTGKTPQSQTGKKKPAPIATKIPGSFEYRVRIFSTNSSDTNFWSKAEANTPIRTNGKAWITMLKKTVTNWGSLVFNGICVNRSPRKKTAKKETKNNLNNILNFRFI